MITNNLFRAHLLSLQQEAVVRIQDHISRLKDCLFGVEGTGDVFVWSGQDLHAAAHLQVVRQIIRFLDTGMPLVAIKEECLRRLLHTTGASDSPNTISQLVNRDRANAWGSIYRFLDSQPLE